MMRTRIPALLAVFALALGACTVVDGPEDLVSESSTTSTAPSTTTTAAETTSTAPSTTTSTAAETTTTQDASQSGESAEIEAACQAAGEAYGEVRTDVEVSTETQSIDEMTGGDDSAVPEGVDDTLCVVTIDEASGSSSEFTLMSTTWTPQEGQDWLDEIAVDDMLSSFLPPDAETERIVLQTESGVEVQADALTLPGYWYDPPEDFDPQNPPEDWDGPNLETYMMFVAADGATTVVVIPGGFNLSMSFDSTSETPTLAELQADMDLARDATLAMFDTFLTS